MPIDPATALYAALLARSEDDDSDFASEVADVLSHPEHAGVLLEQVGHGGTVRKSAVLDAAGHAHSDADGKFASKPGAKEAIESVASQHDVSPDDFVTTEDLNEKDQNRIDSIAEMFPETEAMPPVVYRQDASGSKELLDGHHRYLIAKDRGHSLPSVGLTGAEYEHLSDAGYNKDEIVRAALGAADGVDPEHLSQYDSVYGRPNEEAEMTLRSLRDAD